MANSRQFATVSQLELFKYQALGNDHLVLDLPGPLDELVTVLPLLCDRHLGLGSDGLLAFDPRAMSVRIFNPDRSEAQKSGNGLRIAAAHAVLEHGAPKQFELRTLDRSNAVRVLGGSRSQVVTELDIGRPSFRAADCMRRGLVDDIIGVEMPGGSLAAKREVNGNLFQSGPARRVYRATIDLADFAQPQDGIR